MEIKRDGWLYKIAYGYLSCYNQPREVSLCRLVWRLPYALFIAWPFVLAFWSVCGGVLAIAGGFSYLCLFIVGFFFALAPASGREIFFEPYPKWPSIKGFKILPIYFVITWIVAENFTAIIHELAIWTIYSKFFWGITISFALLMFLLKACKFAIEFEAVKLLILYIRARKQKYCPTLKVV